MSSYNTETRVLRLTRSEASTRRWTLGAEAMEADIIIVNGYMVKNRFYSTGPVPKGHGDVKEALARRLPPLFADLERRRRDEHHDFPLEPGLAPGSMERAFSGKPAGQSPSQVVASVLGPAEGQGQSRRARKRRERRTGRTS